MKKNAILFYYVALDFWWGHHPFKVTRRDRNPYATPSFVVRWEAWAIVGDQPTATFLISHILILYKNDTRVP